MSAAGTDSVFYDSQLADSQSSVCPVSRIGFDYPRRALQQSDAYHYTPTADPTTIYPPDKETVDWLGAVSTVIDVSSLLVDFTYLGLLFGLVVLTPEAVAGALVYVDFLATSLLVASVVTAIAKLSTGEGSDFWKDGTSKVQTGMLIANVLMAFS